jgi:LacI family transcriptional regulator
VLHPPIGAVSRDNLGAGRAAADLLLRRLESAESDPETIMLPTRFLARSSCAPPRRRSQPVAPRRTGAD